MGPAPTESWKDSWKGGTDFQRKAITRNVERADDSSYWRGGFSTLGEKAKIRRLRTRLGPKRLPREKNGGPHRGRVWHVVTRDACSRRKSVRRHSDQRGARGSLRLHSLPHLGFLFRPCAHGLDCGAQSCRGARGERGGGDHEAAGVRPRRRFKAFPATRELCESLYRSLLL